MPGDAVPEVALRSPAAGDDDLVELDRCIADGAKKVMMRSDSAVVLAHIMFLVVDLLRCAGLSADGDDLGVMMVEPDDCV